MFQGFGDTGFHMSFGIGAFPFGFFTTVFNANDPFQRAGNRTETKAFLTGSGVKLDPKGLNGQ